MDEKNYTSSYMYSLGPNRRSMESRSCDVDKYVGLFMHILEVFSSCACKYQTTFPLIHTSPVICKLHGSNVGIEISIL